MYATDFIYDGKYLSDYHFVICSIDGNESTAEISAGSEITFNQISINNGSKHALTSIKYEKCVTATFDICKDPDYYNDIEISEIEHYKIIRWLNRKEFKRFSFRTNYIRRCYYNASFNISNIYVNDMLVGFRLSMFTDMPYGFGDDINISINSTEENQNFIIHNESDETGYLYPIINIKAKNNGSMEIKNLTYENLKPMIIDGCITGENITVDCKNQIITSDKRTDICEYFNFRFLALGSDYFTNENEIVVSLPSTVKITYTPIIKNIN